MFDSWLLYAVVYNVPFVLVGAVVAVLAVQAPTRRRGLFLAAGLCVAFSGIIDLGWNVLDRFGVLPLAGVSVVFNIEFTLTMLLMAAGALLLMIAAARRPAPAGAPPGPPAQAPPPGGPTWRAPPPQAPGGW